jgi:hypothetical protein
MAARDWDLKKDKKFKNYELFIIRVILTLTYSHVFALTRYKIIILTT